jgi:hypothetical protein
VHPRQKASARHFAEFNTLLTRFLNSKQSISARLEPNLDTLSCAELALATNRLKVVNQDQTFIRR